MWREDDEREDTDMANNKGFGVRPGARVSAQQIMLIAVSALAVVLLVMTLIAFGRANDMAREVQEGRSKLISQYSSEINAIDILMNRQENESGDARINTLAEVKQHIYAADAFSVYGIAAYGGEELMSTDEYSALMTAIDQSIQQLRAGNRPDDSITEVRTALDAVRRDAAAE